LRKIQKDSNCFSSRLRMQAGCMQGKGQTRDVLVPNVLHGGFKAEYLDMFKSVATISAILSISICFSAKGQDKVPKELVQYVQDAQKAGLNPFKIQENAVNAGWPSALVSDALVQVKAMDKTKPADEAAGKGATPAGNAAESSLAAAPASTPHSALAAGSVETPQPTGNPKPPADSVAGTAEPAGGTPVPTAKKLPETQSAADPTASGAAGAVGAKPAVDRNGSIPDDYEIGAGDILKITVWHEADASLPSVVVPPNGKISMPLLHDVEVAGMKVPDLEKSLTERLSTFITAPEVSVVVTGMNSKKIYITGKVKREGPLAYAYRMTVMQALSEAGGLSDYAKKKGIYILRTENGRQFKLPFDYVAVLKGEHLETNIPLLPGDMIVVP
jgi:polysaccharide export outer membrane protein